MFQSGTSKSRKALLGKFYERKLAIISYPSVHTCVVGAQKNRLIETVFEYLQQMFWIKNKNTYFYLKAWLDSSSTA